MMRMMLRYQRLPSGWDILFCSRLRQVVAEYPKPPADKRLVGAQDLAWALLNSKAFLFNH